VLDTEGENSPVKRSVPSDGSGRSRLEGSGRARLSYRGQALLCKSGGQAQPGTNSGRVGEPAVEMRLAARSELTAGTRAELEPRARSLPQDSSTALQLSAWMRASRSTGLGPLPRAARTQNVAEAAGSVEEPGSAKWVRATRSPTQLVALRRKGADGGRRSTRRALLIELSRPCGRAEGRLMRAR
jgi:hypothetical protein